MKRIATISLAVVLATAASAAARAYKPARPLQFSDIAGEWIGQCALGDVFRLNLEADQTGSLGYIRPQWEDDEVSVYTITDLNFDGFDLTITLDHPNYGQIQLKGRTHRDFMDLRIKGVYRKSKPQIRLLRADAWNAALGRLRTGM